MRQVLKFLLLAAVCVLIGGCSEKTEQTGFKIYCTDSGRTKLTEESYKPNSNETDAFIKEILEKLKGKPDTQEYISAIPKDVHITEYVLNGSQLTLSFDEAYLTMDNVTEALMKAAVVKTLVQINGIEEVFFQVGENALLDDQGDRVGAMKEDAFIDTKGKGINSYQFASLTLYFANEEGDKMMKEMRNVHYSTNTTLEKVVIEQLIAGPANKNLQPVLSASTKVAGITAEKEICTINFDELLVETKVTPEVSLYAIVNSIIDSCSVSKVQLQIQGSSDVLYAEEINLKNPLKKNKKLIWKGESDEKAVDHAVKSEENEKEINTHEPTIGVDPNLKKESDTAGESK